MCHEQINYSPLMWTQSKRFLVFPHDFRVEQGSVEAQTKGQYHLLYGTEGTQALFTGLDTQIVYGGCDHNVQKILEALVEVWSEELAHNGRIKLENFLVLEVKRIDRGEQAGALLINGKLRRAPRIIRKLTVRPSKSLKGRLGTS